MTETTKPTASDDPKADETFTWTGDAPSPNSVRSTATSTAASIIDSVRDVVDEIAEKAAPAVREISARAAELTAIAADRAAPLAKRAGEVTADASGKLAAKSRGWATDLRSSVGVAEPTTDQAGSPDPTTEASDGDGSGSANQS